jgi:hypothetical protein
MQLCCSKVIVRIPLKGKVAQKINTVPDLPTYVT